MAGKVSLSPCTGLPVLLTNMELARLPRTAMATSAGTAEPTPGAAWLRLYLSTAVPLNALKKVRPSG